MAKSELKLIKSKKLTESPISNLPSPISPAEQAEAARFRALTAAKAARQAMLRQIMAELQDFDEVSSAA